ncbi:hypothetical protein EMCRGX_G019967 [Ephydatia muelleri]
MSNRITDITKQVLASVFYGVASILIITVNKDLFATYQFPSFQVVGLGQIFTTIVVITLARLINVIHFEKPSLEQAKNVFPLPVFYLLNLMFGLGSTQRLNLPMFTVLRRFTLIFVSVGQVIILKKKERFPVQLTLAVMVVGAIVAALNDITYDTYGYFFVLMNDVTTAANTLYVKKRLNAEMDKYELMLYNSFIVSLPALCLAYYTGELQRAYEFTGWQNPWFILSFTLSCVMGFILNYSTMLCTQLTSALTVTVVGAIKNIAVTYGGMFIHDYIFTVYNFIGINISVAGSLLYSYLKYSEQSVTTKSAVPA